MIKFGKAVPPVKKVERITGSLSASENVGSANNPI